MGNLQKRNDTTLAINIQKVESKIAVIRNIEVIADADIAGLYGVETRRINEAVKNNPDKFPTSYMFILNKSELLDLRSKISPTTDAKPSAMMLASNAEVRRRKSKV